MDAEYKPPPEFELDTREPLIDINLTDSQELWLIRLPFGEDLLNDLDGQLLSLNLHGNDGQLSSFEGSSGKVYDFISDDTKKVNEYVFISSSTNEPKIAGMISRHVSVVHYPDPEELEMRMNPNNPKRNPSGNDRTTYSQPFPKKSYGSGHAASTQGSRPKSSLSEVGEQSNNPKRRRTAESEDYTFELSRGHSSGISVASSDQSHGVKSKRRSKHEE